MLSEENRLKLDDIVSQMELNKETEEDIRFVVEDFKSKYDQQQITPEKQEPVIGTPPAGAAPLGTFPGEQPSAAFTPESQAAISEFKKQDVPSIAAEKIGKVGEFVGSITPVSPAILGSKTFFDKLGEGKDFDEALKEGLKVAGTDLALQYTGGKILKAAGKGIARLKALGSSEKVLGRVFEKPQIFTKSKRSWQAIKNEALEVLNKKKKKIGSTLGALKKEATEIGIDTYKDTDGLLEGLNSIKSQISPEAISDTKKIDRMIEIVKGRHLSGSQISNIEKAKGVFEVYPIEKEALKAVNLEDSIKILDDIDNISGMNTIQNKANLPEQFGSLSNSERLILEARKRTKDFTNEILDEIPDYGAEIKKLKSDYKDIMDIKVELGALNKNNIGQKLEQALKRNNEDKFDLLSKHLPENLIDETISNVINVTKTSPRIPIGKFAAISEAFSSISRPFGEAVIAGASKAPSYPIGATPRALYGVAPAVSKGLGATARLGVRELMEEERGRQ